MTEFEDAVIAMMAYHTTLLATLTLATVEPTKDAARRVEIKNLVGGILTSQVEMLEVLKDKPGG